METIIPSFFPPRKSGLSRGVSIRAIYNGDAMQGRGSVPSCFSLHAFGGRDRARPRSGRQKGGHKARPADAWGIQM
jgi:hypothetical protein